MILQKKTERRDGHFVVISILFSKPKSASYRALWPCILNLLDGENLENSQIWNSYCSTCGQGGICILNIPVLWIQDTPHHHSINSSPVHLVFLQATNQRVPPKNAIHWTGLIYHSQINSSNHISHSPHIHLPHSQVVLQSHQMTTATTASLKRDC